MRTTRQWRWVFLAFVAAALLTSLLSAAFAGSAAASEGNHPAQSASFLTWHTDNFFTQCDGNCAVSIFGGPQLLTHQYNILVHLTPPWDWRFGNADLIGGAISRRILTLWDSLDIEPEFGLAKRFGSMHTEEAWLVLYFRWTRFPWNEYLRNLDCDDFRSQFCRRPAKQRSPQCNYFELFLAGDYLCAATIPPI